MDETRLPLTEHLAELRTRIVRILIAWLVGSVAAWNFSDEIFALLLAPAVNALGEGQSLQAIAPAEIFFSYVKCALLAGFLFALPVIFWQIWASSVTLKNSRRRSFDARRNSARLLPSVRASSGSFFGPSTTSPITKITMSSVMPMPNMRER